MTFLDSLVNNQAIVIEEIAQIIAVNYEEVNPPRSIF